MWLMAAAFVLIVGGCAFAIDTALQGRRADDAEAARVQRIRSQGRETEATATRVWMSSGRHTDYLVEYRFWAAGSVYGGRAGIQREHWLPLQVGSPIGVRYLPSDPAQSYPSADPPRPAAAWPLVLFFGAIIVAGGFVLFWMVLRERKLLVEGHAGPGFIEGWEGPGLSRHGAKPGYVAIYEFRLPNGTKVHGRYYSGKDQPVSGDVICVLYLPKNPKRNSRYPLSFFRIATP